MDREVTNVEKNVWRNKIQTSNFCGDSETWKAIRLQTALQMIAERKIGVNLQ